MKKDQKFLKELESNLSKISKKKRTIIIEKYRKIIDEELNNKKRIADILKEIGTPIQVAEKELKKLKENKPITKITKKIKRKNEDISEKSKELNEENQEKLDEVKKQKETELIETKKDNEQKEQIKEETNDLRNDDEEKNNRN